MTTERRVILATKKDINSEIRFSADILPPKYSDQSNHNLNTSKKSIARFKIGKLELEDQIIKNEQDYKLINTKKKLKEELTEDKTIINNPSESPPKELQELIKKDERSEIQIIVDELLHKAIGTKGENYKIKEETENEINRRLEIEENEEISLIIKQDSKISPHERKIPMIDRGDAVREFNYN